MEEQYTRERELIASLSARRRSRADPEIMVVDDDQFSLDMVGRLLQGKFSCTLVSDGKTALMKYVIKPPDVLFLDIGLPDMGGHAVLKELFKIDPNAYVIMLSGRGTKKNVIETVKLGAQGFIKKPFAQEKLFGYIHKSPFIRQKDMVKQKKSKLQIYDSVALYSNS